MRIAEIDVFGDGYIIEETLISDENPANNAKYDDIEAAILTEYLLMFDVRVGAMFTQRPNTVAVRKIPSVAFSRKVKILLEILENLNNRLQINSIYIQTCYREQEFIRCESISHNMSPGNRTNG